jgi:hypothetical protein
MTITPQQAQALVDELVMKNKIGDQFTHSVPEDWPIESWRLLLKAECECWDTENLHCWIASHVYAPEEIVRILAQSSEWRVRSRISEKRNLPKDLFLVMAKDEDEGVRQHVARNKKTPLEVVESLKNDPAETVRRLVKMRLDPK